MIEFIRQMLWPKGIQAAVRPAIDVPLIRRLGFKPVGPLVWEMILGKIVNPDSVLMLVLRDENVYFPTIMVNGNGHDLMFIKYADELERLVDVLRPKELP